MDFSLASLPGSAFSFTQPDTSPVLGGYRGEGTGSMGINRNPWSFSNSFFSDPKYAPFQSKYNQVYGNEDGSLSAIFQQPGRGKYDLVNARYSLNPSTNQYSLADSSPFKQESSLRSGIRTAAVPAAFIGAAMLAPYLTGALSGIGGSTIAGGSGLLAPGAAAGLGGTGAGLSTTAAMASALTPTFGAGASVLGAAGTNALMNGGFTAAQGGDSKDILRSAAIGGVSGGTGAYLGNNYGQLAGRIGQAATGTVLSGGSGSDLVRNSALAGLSGITDNVGSSMMDSLANNPLFSSISNVLGFARQNAPQLGNVAEGLAGIYQGYQQKKMAKEFMRGYGTNRGSYETQLRNSLSRRDAASGRRSDYSGRETQLQAALAELDSRNAPAMLQAQQAKMGGNLGMLQSLLRFGGKSGMFSAPQQMSYSNPNLQSLATLGMPQVSFPYDLSQLGRRNIFGGG